MKTTPFTHFHLELGAKMQEFAGYNMPIEYSSISDEHLAVRQKVGVFDVSHMGEILVKGPKALTFLQKMTTNDVASLPLGKAQYSCFTNEAGGIIDDLLVYHIEPEKYLLVINAANVEKDWEWCVLNNSENAEIKNISDQVAQLAVQGPLAIHVIQKLTSIPLSKIPYYHFTIGKVAEIEPVLLSNTGYTGAGGFELYFSSEYADKIWNVLFEAGKEFGIQPIGLGARDTLRLEKGFCLHGNDIDETTTPLEAGLDWITKFIPEKNFIGRPALEKQKEKGIQRKLIRFELLEKGIPRHGYDILNLHNEIIGKVTSGSFIPGDKTGIGMGYIKTDYAKKDTEIYIQIRNKSLPAKIVK
ncbi:MAG TPA: glycine cleavage system aminomethyltransferase GcvT [Paludibacteraceae bacterium]|nr:glycine cleavage system aminomethyltransferase GcvT [Paludibacteraceae bacterium]